MNVQVGGSSEDSAKQSSERDSRAARRYIRSVPQVNLASDSDNDDAYQEANQSLEVNPLLNLDGEFGHPDMDAAALAAEKAKPFQDADFPDDPEAWKKEIKVKFDAQDICYWFNTVESQMKKFGINKQWSKKGAIASLLPDEVTEECKPILRLSEDEAGTHVYRTLKTEILDLYGPRDEDAFKKAIA